jgi:hypothetical protein
MPQQPGACTHNTSPCRSQDRDAQSNEADRDCHRRRVCHAVRCRCGPCSSVSRRDSRRRHWLCRCCRRSRWCRLVVEALHSEAAGPRPAEGGPVQPLRRRTGQLRGAHHHHASNPVPRFEPARVQQQTLRISGRAQWQLAGQTELHLREALGPVQACCPDGATCWPGGTPPSPARAHRHAHHAGRPSHEPGRPRRTVARRGIQPRRQRRRRPRPGAPATPQPHRPGHGDAPTHHPRRSGPTPHHAATTHPQTPPLPRPPRRQPTGGPHRPLRPRRAPCPIGVPDHHHGDRDRGREHPPNPHLQRHVPPRPRPNLARQRPGPPSLARARAGAGRSPSRHRRGATASARGASARRTGAGDAAGPTPASPASSRPPLAPPAAACRACSWDCSGGAAEEEAAGGCCAAAGCDGAAEGGVCVPWGEGGFWGAVVRGSFNRSWWVGSGWGRVVREGCGWWVAGGLESWHGDGSGSWAGVGWSARGKQGRVQRWGSSGVNLRACCMAWWHCYAGRVLVMLGVMVMLGGGSRRVRSCSSQCNRAMSRTGAMSGDHHGRLE